MIAARVRLLIVLTAGYTLFVIFWAAVSAFAFVPLLGHPAVVMTAGTVPFGALYGAWGARRFGDLWDGPAAGSR